MLSTSSLLVEQLRYLLTVHDGRLPTDQVESIYTSTFGIQSHINIAGLLERNKLIRVAPHVVNVIGNNKWLVWSPTGRPYPNRATKNDSVQSKESTTQVFDLDAGGNESAKVGITDKCEASADEHSTNTHTDDIAVAKDSEHPVASQLKPHPLLSEPSTSPDDSKMRSTAHCETTKSSESSVSMLVGDTRVNTNKSIPTTDDTEIYTHFVDSNVDLHTGSADGPSQTNGDSGEVTAETYGFLEETLEPELMAELRASGEQHQQREQTLSELLNSRPISEHAIQLLLHFAKPMDEIDLDDDNSDDADEPEKQVADEPERSPAAELEKHAEIDQPNEPVDYLASGMSPDQVLEEMRKLKERSGGYLSPDKMEPFLTYFGELSSRELDRLESLEEAAKPKLKKGAAKKKRVMAIRFPDKSPAPPPPSDDDPYKEQRLYSTELLKDKLPAAPDFENMSDSSDSDGSCPRPLEREEYIQTLLQRGIPSLTDEEVLRATQLVSANKADNNHSASDWSSPNAGNGMEADDLPEPLLSTSKAGRIAAHRLFGNAQFMDTSVTDSEANEWPDLN